MTKPLILATALLALAGCADESVETGTPIGPDPPVLDGPAEVVTEPTDDAVMDPALDTLDGTDDGALADDTTLTGGAPVTDGAM